MPPQPKMTWLDRMLYTSFHKDGCCMTCVYVGAQDCRRHAPLGSITSSVHSPRYPIIIDNWSHWCGDHELDRKQLKWDPIWGRACRRIRGRFKMRRRHRKWAREDKAAFKAMEAK